MLARPRVLDPDIFTLEVGNAADAFSGKQLETADVFAPEDGDRRAGVDGNDRVGA